MKKKISLVQEKQGKKSTPCKHWNKGFCKNKYCEYMHSKDDCQFHIDGGNCQDNNCPKRHRNTCRDWYNEGCGRKQRCAYLHKDIYDSRRIYHSGSRSISNHINGNQSAEREGKKLARKGVTAEEVAEEEAVPEEKVIATKTAEKAMEAEMNTREGVKAGATLKAAVKMKTKIFV